MTIDNYRVAAVNDVNVPEGYKSTNVGIIPEDWTIDRLGEKTIKIGSGITPTGGEKVYKNEGRPFLRSQNVAWGYLSLDDIVFIDDEIHNTFKATEIKKLDVFLNITGASIGRSAIADHRVENGNVNQHVCILRTNRHELNPFFLNHYLLSYKGQKQIDSFQAGGNREGLNFGQIKSFKIPLPPLPEQKAIARVLSDVDELIRECDSLLAKKRDIKQGTMQQLLTGKKRLPGFSGEWEEKKIGEICNTSSGTTPSRQLSDRYYYNGYINWVKTTDLNNSLLYSSEEQITELALKETSLKIYPPKTVLIAMYGGFNQIGRTGLLQIPATVNQALTAIQPQDYLLDSFYLINYLNYRVDYWKIVAISSRKDPNITSRDVKNFPVLLPTLPEQKAIAHILSDMDAEIEALEQKRDKYKAIKQGMMQELLTGKTRLIDN